MRLIFSLLTLGGCAFGGWYAWEHVPLVQEFAQKIPTKTPFQTLEVRYSAQEIMRLHKEELIKSSGYTYLEPETLYSPYLLMDVKYTKDSSTTSEGTLLWGLNDGEMVIDTITWEKTHGFEDCLLTKASKNDFKIIKAIVEHAGTIDREKLYSYFQVDSDILDDWVDSCREKKLIVTSGNQFRLHFSEPRFEVKPATQLSQTLVTKTAKSATKIGRRYSPSQIQKLAEVVFGSSFAIRKSEEVFLPVYAIGIQNPDGSTSLMHFNALNGKSICLR